MNNLLGLGTSIFYKIKDPLGRVLRFAAYGIGPITDQYFSWVRGGYLVESECTKLSYIHSKKDWAQFQIYTCVMRVITILDRTST